jgi:hypothetical protein
MLKATYIIADRGGSEHAADAIAARLHLAFPAYPSRRLNPHPR